MSASLSGLTWPSCVRCVCILFQCKNECQSLRTDLTIMCEVCLYFIPVQEWVPVSQDWLDHHVWGVFVFYSSARMSVSLSGLTWPSCLRCFCIVFQCKNECQSLRTDLTIMSEVCLYCIPVQEWVPVSQDWLDHHVWGVFVFYYSASLSGPTWPSCLRCVCIVFQCKNECQSLRTDLTIMTEVCLYCIPVQEWVPVSQDWLDHHVWGVCVLYSSARMSASLSGLTWPSWLRCVCIVFQCKNEYQSLRTDLTIMSEVCLYCIPVQEWVPVSQDWIDHHVWGVFVFYSSARMSASLSGLTWPSCVRCVCIVLQCKNECQSLRTDLTIMSEVCLYCIPVQEWVPVSQDWLDHHVLRCVCIVFQCKNECQSLRTDLTIMSEVCLYCIPVQEWVPVSQDWLDHHVLRCVCIVFQCKNECQSLRTDLTIMSEVCLYCIPVQEWVPVSQDWLDHHVWGVFVLYSSARMSASLSGLTWPSCVRCVCILLQCKNECQSLRTDLTIMSEVCLYFIPVQEWVPVSQDWLDHHVWGVFVLYSSARMSASLSGLTWPSCLRCVGIVFQCKNECQSLRTDLTIMSEVCLCSIPVQEWVPVSQDWLDHHVWGVLVLYCSARMSASLSRLTWPSCLRCVCIVFQCKNECQSLRTDLTIMSEVCLYCIPVQEWVPVSQDWLDHHVWGVFVLYSSARMSASLSGLTWPSCLTCVCILFQCKNECQSLRTDLTIMSEVCLYSIPVPVSQDWLDHHVWGVFVLYCSARMSASLSGLTWPSCLRCVCIVFQCKNECQSLRTDLTIMSEVCLYFIPVQEWVPVSQDWLDHHVWGVFVLYSSARMSASLSGLTWPSCLRCVCILFQCKNECQSLRTDLTIMSEVCLYCIAVQEWVPVSQDWLDHHVWGVFVLYSSARMSASLSGLTWPSCLRCVCIVFQCKNECQSLRTDLTIMSEVCLYFIPVQEWVPVSQDWLDHHVWGVFVLYSSARMSASLSGLTWPSCLRCVCILFQCKNECQSLRTDLTIMSEVCLYCIPVQEWVPVSQDWLDHHVWGVFVLYSSARMSASLSGLTWPSCLRCVCIVFQCKNECQSLRTELTIMSEVCLYCIPVQEWVPVSQDWLDHHVWGVFVFYSSARMSASLSGLTWPSCLRCVCILFQCQSLRTDLTIMSEVWLYFTPVQEWVPVSQDWLDHHVWGVFVLYSSARMSASLSGLTWPSCLRCVCIVFQCKNECQSLETDLTIMSEVCLYSIPVPVSQDWLDHHVWGVFVFYCSARSSTPRCVPCFRGPERVPRELAARWCIDGVNRARWSQLQSGRWLLTQTAREETCCSIPQPLLYQSWNTSWNEK